MSGEFHAASAERVNAFPVEDVVLFRHYFEGEDVFEKLRTYYDNQQYRFAVPTDEFDAVAEFLADHDYALARVDDPEPYAVAVRKYTDHPGNIFKSSVYHRSVGNYNVFVLKDRDAVEDAVERGARRLADTDLSLSG